MNELQTNQDTIVAIATAPGRGGVGIVRISGKQAIDIAQAMTQSKLELKPRFAHYTAFYDQHGNEIDQGLILYFPGPNSFTGEHVVEIQGHGGPIILDSLVKTAIAQGARQAEPGEFSLRAFLNDRMDLVQAEAIADLIDAGTEASARAAMQSLQGAFSKAVNDLVEALIQLRLYVEAAIDFPEEEIDFLSDGRVASDLEKLTAQIQQVLAEARQGQLLREGMTVVIAGRPNAGKSSLLNALAGKERAIVTDIAGTTRDILQEQIQLDGMPLHIVDTAGLRESPDRVEQEGIRRAWQAIEEADHLVVVVDMVSLEDGQVPQTLEALLPQGQLALAELTIPVTLVLNKIDRCEELDDQMLEQMCSGNTWPTFAISALNGQGLMPFKAHLKDSAGFQSEHHSRFSARRRHVTALELAQQALNNGFQQLHEHQAGELLAEDLRSAQQALEEITGAFTSDDLLGRIFSSFCIGK